MHLGHFGVVPESAQRSMQYRTPEWLEGKQVAGQATNEMILFSRASATRARCLEHALENFAWTTSVIPWAWWRCTTVPGTNRSINPDEAVGYVLQYRAQSSR